MSTSNITPTNSNWAGKTIQLNLVGPREGDGEHLTETYAMEIKSEHGITCALDAIRVALESASKTSKINPDRLEGVFFMAGRSNPDHPYEPCQSA